MLTITDKTQKILNFYESESPGVKTNLATLLGHGSLGGTGKLLILPVDQGFEHGPTSSYAINEEAFDPYYHYELAIKAKVSAYAAPIGALEVGANKFAGMIPTILKMNSSNTLLPGNIPANQAITSSIKDALRLGCIGIGFTIYPGSADSNNMYEQFKELSIEAKNHGLFTVVWSYPRGPSISKKGETAIDTVSYGAHIAALLGAHVIKVKLPSNYIEDIKAKELLKEKLDSFSDLKNRVSYVVKSCFNGKRIVVFSGGPTQKSGDIFNEIISISKGGGHGSIIGRNSFQRKFEEGLSMLNNIIKIYKQNT
jgi:class I fructose-bisphosphate aldolase